MKKLPELYKADNIKENNEKSFLITNDSKQDIKEKINDIFNSKTYVYKADVVIYLKDKTLNTRVIGKNEKFLITDKSQIIKIEDIIDIKKSLN